jgi:hypothetical protein
MSFYPENPPDIGLKVENFLQKHGVSYQDTTNSLIVTCPQCSSDKLYLNKNIGNFICYKCADAGIKGPSPYRALSLLTNLSIQDIKNELEVIDTYVKLPQASAISKVTSVYIPKRLISISSQEAQEGANYLYKRGIDLETADKYNLHYDPQPDSRGVVFLCKEGSRYVGYQRRSVDPLCPKERQKYTMSGFEKSKHFLFQEYIKGDSVILAEGPISAIKFAKTGVPFVASMGKAISKHQVDKLVSLGIKNVYLGLDKDAYKEINTFIQKYSTIFNIFYLKVPAHRDDFGDCTFAEAIEVYRNAEYLILPLEFDALKLGRWCY